MEKIKIKIHPTFIIFSCILIYFGKSLLFFNYLLVMFCHEYSHAYIAKLLGYSIKNIKVIPFGICLNINSNNILPKDEIKIALAGPITNFILMFITMASWWVFPSLYNYTCFFCYANFITGVFNLIPAFPLDGGRVLLSLLKQKLTQKNAVKFCKLINIFVIICLVILFIFSCFYAVNITYLLVVFCVLTGLTNNDRMQSYSLINYGVLKKIGKVIKAKSLIVKGEEPLFKLCKHIDNFSYIIVNVINENKQIVATLTEADFLLLLEKFGANTTFNTIINNDNI